MATVCLKGIISTLKDLFPFVSEIDSRYMFSPQCSCSLLLDNHIFLIAIIILR